jgi:pullulanase
MMGVKQIADNIRFLENMPDRVVAYSINGSAVNDKWKNIFVVFNGNAAEMKIVLPEGRWQKFSLPGQSLYTHKSFRSIIVSPHSCNILYN